MIFNRHWSQNSQIGGEDAYDGAIDVTMDQERSVRALFEPEQELSWITSFPCGRVS